MIILFTIRAFCIKSILPKNLWHFYRSYDFHALFHFLPDCHQAGDWFGDYMAVWLAMISLIHRQGPMAFDTGPASLRDGYTTSLVSTAMGMTRPGGFRATDAPSFAVMRQIEQSPSAIH
jgi:hypothetical protein